MTIFTLADLRWLAHFMRQERALDKAQALLTARLRQIYFTGIEGLSAKGLLIFTKIHQESTGEYAVGDWRLMNSLAREELMKL